MSFCTHYFSISIFLLSDSPQFITLQMKFSSSESFRAAVYKNKGKPLTKRVRIIAFPDFKFFQILLWGGLWVKITQRPLYEMIREDVRSVSLRKIYRDYWRKQASTRKQINAWQLVMWWDKNTVTLEFTEIWSHWFYSFCTS